MACESNSTTLFFPNNQVVNGWSVTYNPMASDPVNNRFCYDVDVVGNPQDLSHFTVGIDCPPEFFLNLTEDNIICTLSTGDEVDCDVVRTPPTGEVAGIKFENFGDLDRDNLPVTFCVTFIDLEQPLFLGCVEVSGKAGQEVDIGEETIPGPSCTPPVTTTTSSTTSTTSTTSTSTTSSTSTTTTSTSTTSTTSTSSTTTVCPIPNPQTCCQVIVEFKTQLVPPALTADGVTTRIYFSEAPTIEDVCPEKVIVCGKVTKEITYTMFDEELGMFRENTIYDEEPFQCFIDRDDANEDDPFEVVGYAVLCEGTPRLQNRGTIETTNNETAQVHWKLIEKDVIKVCIRKIELP